MLFKDELRGYYKSKVMVFLWIGLPVLTIIFHFWNPSTGDELPFTMVVAILLSSLGGTLGAVMLVVSIINEKNRRVYDLFLIRPIRRMDILFAKFFAVYVCLAIAIVIALVFGLAVDYFASGYPPAVAMSRTTDSVVASLCMMAISCAVGVLIGIGSPSILVGAILVIYGGNQLSIMPLLPTILGISNPLLFSIVLGVLLAAVFMTISVIVFNRKQF
jgi:ABC-2 type transport system permease protein